MGLTRRHFGALSLGLGVPVLRGACSTGALSPYDESVRELWRHGRVYRNDAVAVERELVRYAALASLRRPVRAVLA
jgi:hypothetical protein